MLFVVYLGMSPKGKEKLQRLFKLHDLNHPSAFGATSALRHEDRLEKVWCDDGLLFVFRHGCSREDFNASHGRVSKEDWRENGARS